MTDTDTMELREVPGDTRADAQAILDMLCDTMLRLNKGLSADDIPCHRIAELIEADAAATVAIEPDTEPYVCATYPNQQTAQELAEYLLSLSPGELPEHFRADVHPSLGHVIVVSIRPDQTDVELVGYSRVLSFARRIPFDASDYLALDRACRPLSALWPHAARAFVAARNHQPTRESDPDHEMTVRELQVLSLLAEGRLATSIASRLALSPRTVHKHLGNIYRKLGVHDRLVAVSLARVRGLVDDPLAPSSPSSPPSR